MRARNAILVVLAVAAVAAALILLLDTGEGSAGRGGKHMAVPGEPSVEIVSPRNGARQLSHAVVVKVNVHDFHLAPAHFGGEPLLGEGHIRFGLNRVPNCVEPSKLQKALNSPIGKKRLVGRSFDFARYSGPNGVLAERIGSAGSYSPATRPEIYYHALPPGFYRLVVNLADNNGATTPFHAVTNFEILPRPNHGPKPCRKGKVSSAKAAAAFD